MKVMIDPESYRSRWSTKLVCDGIYRVPRSTSLRAARSRFVPGQLDHAVAGMNRTTRTFPIPINGYCSSCAPDAILGMHSASHHGKRSVPRTARPLLTKREVQIIHLICKPEEPTLRQIGALWNVNPKTVGKHLESIYRKLKVHTRIELFIKVVEQGLVKCPCGSPIPSLLAPRPWEDPGLG